MVNKSANGADGYLRHNGVNFTRNVQETPPREMKQYVCATLNATHWTALYVETLKDIHCKINLRIRAKFPSLVFMIIAILLVF